MPVELVAGAAEYENNSGYWIINTIHATITIWENSIFEVTPFNSLCGGISQKSPMPGILNKRRKKGVVTVVIAAYGRPLTLNKTLASLYRQTYNSWKALVICDCCTNEFIEQVDRSDTRVTLINLPMRSGHQYGPNSVGIHLADSEYIAYLNHDDLWVEDHLENAILALRKGATAYLGRAAFCHPKNQPGWQNVSKRLMFSEINRPDILWRCQSGPFYFFEPASAWVIESDLARQVGYWLPPDKTDITPVMDWLMRLARESTKYHISDTISVLKMNLHHRDDTTNSNVPFYHREETNLLPYLDHLLSIPAELLRSYITEDLAQAASLGLRVRPEMGGEQIEISPGERDRINGFLLYLETGIRVKELVGSIIGPYKSINALNSLLRRTGESQTSFTSVEKIIAAYQKVNKTMRR